MENYRGDLADIVRASGGGAIQINGGEGPGESWQFLGDQHPMNYDFGDPFSNIRDPLLLGQVDHLSNSSYLMSSSISKSTEMIKTSAHHHHHEDRVSSSSGHDYNDILFGDQQKKKNSISSVSSNSSSAVVGEEMIKKRSPTAANCNIFSRMLQISPNTTKLSPPPPPPPPLSPPCLHSIKPLPPPPLLLSSSSSNDIISTATANTSKGCLLENTGGVQISSPRNTGIKRRKSQAKRVVCIPAPAPANSRPTGEVVPSDLWAWRKYGQKPIKGSPYPRGYYRCSSSKGCSARKQVERSRTDPNMLVITYTSEHNHTWPTQRNALAGSTRAQPSKNNNSAAGGSKININSPILSSSISHEAQKKEEQYDPSVKQEILEVEIDHHHHHHHHHHDNRILEMDSGDHHHHQFGEGGSYHDHHQSYRPTLPEDSNVIVQSSADQDFFADLGEIEADPLNLLFTQGFSGGDERENNKASLDPFTDLFDWTCNNNK